MSVEFITLDAEKGRELGLSEADFVLLTETGLPRDVADHFCTDIPDGPFGLFAVRRLNADNHALILGGTSSDGGLVYFLDVNDGNVVLLSWDDDGEPQYEGVNTTLSAFAEFVVRLGAYTESTGAELEKLDPEAFRHPHCWWAMVAARYRREAARRERMSAPAASHSDAFDRALDRLEEKGWRHVSGKEFASATDEYGLLTLPEDFSKAFAADGALIRDFSARWRGGLPPEIQSAFAWEGLVVLVSEEEQDEGDFDAIMDQMLAAIHDRQQPTDGTLTCLATEETSDLCRILRAFGRLAAKGYVAEPALWPTTSGCWERVAERTEDTDSPKAVFWNTQSHDRAFDARGDLIDELYLGWAGDHEEIAAALAETGLTVKVPENEGTTFILGPAETP
ncbi:SUKH-4 family immunity protein [Nonomuraea longicatena]|uniref:Knr4/Smi1-like domain-containing protein n=1 Tax=Nonomuraea longicatena TaxID=83682 RepID=A0ABP3Z5W3_9ACTN